MYSTFNVTSARYLLRVLSLLLIEVFYDVSQEELILHIHQCLLDLVTLYSQQQTQEFAVLIQVLTSKEVVDVVHGVNKCLLQWLVSITVVFVKNQRAINNFAAFIRDSIDCVKCESCIWVPPVSACGQSLRDN